MRRSAKAMAIPAKVKAAFVQAKKVREQAYAPYSKFKVGAAIITGSGSIVTGCNVENASYGGTVCAERVAILKAVSEGDRVIEHVVVVTDGKAPAYPCALCLQTMAEFLEPDSQIWVADLTRIQSHHGFSELLPHSFGPRELALGLARKSKRQP